MIYRNSKLLFRGQRVDLLSIEADHPQGGFVKREVISHPGAVVILPLLDPETIILIRNDRYAVQKELIELPAGTLEKGEDPLLCAARELQEETGYQAKQLEPLLHFYPSPGFCNEILYGYKAIGLTFIGQDLDETEKISVEPTSLKKALKMIQTGEICDAKTICLLLFYSQSL